MSMLSNDVSFERASILLNHQRVPTRWLGRALEWHSRGQRFDPAYLHHERHKSEIRFRKEADFCLCSKGHYVQAAVELLKVNIKVDVQLIVPANLHPLD